MELIPVGTKIDFLGKAKYAFLLSAILVVSSIYLWVSSGDSKYGIDFMGGHEIVVKAQDDKGSQPIREALEKNGIDDSIVQSFEVGSNEYSIRLGGDAGDAKSVRDKVQSILQAAFPGSISIIKTDYVGPTMGAELKRDALIALMLGLAGMLVYIAFRFEMSYAFGAVVALAHDVIVAMGVYLFCGHTINMSTLAAALTIVGYSLNDTIVIFDRVREEARKDRNHSQAELINESLNVTLSRTIITSLLTFFSALALFLIGGGAISDLSLFLVAGIVTGSYSTIYIASPATLFWEKIRGGKAKS